MGANRESAHKEFVDVIAAHWRDGRVEPLRFQLSNGEKVIIDRVEKVARGASLKAGGCGIRYTCRATNNETGIQRTLDLYDDEGFWFIEK